MRAFEVLSLFTMTVSPTLRSLGFTYVFLSAYCFIFLLALVSRSLMLESSAMGGIRCGRRFFMAWPNCGWGCASGTMWYRPVVQQEFE